MEEKFKIPVDCNKQGRLVYRCIIPDYHERERLQPLVDAVERVFVPFERNKVSEKLIKLYKQIPEIFCDFSWLYAYIKDANIQNKIREQLRDLAEKAKLNGTSR